MTEETAMPLEGHEFRALVSRQRAELGVFSEMLVASKFARAGYAVSRPLNGTQKGYDLIVDDDERLLRVQVKTLTTQGQVSVGYRKAVRDWETGARKFIDIPKYADGAFDILAAVDRDTLEVYLVDIKDIDLSKSSFTLKSMEFVTL